MRIILLSILALVYASCGYDLGHLEDRIVEIDHLREDTLIKFENENGDLLKMYREIEILENNNEDTLSLGYVIIFPNEVGKITFIQIDTTRSNAEYVPDLDPTQNYAYSKMFTLKMRNKDNYSLFRKIVLKLKVEKIDKSKK